MASKRNIQITNEEELKEIHCNECLLPQHIPKIPIYGTYNLQDKIQPGVEYEYCACGYSNEQPFCDKSCKQDKPEFVDENGNQKFTGIKFTARVGQTLFNFCGCKYTQTPPMCDGTHGPMPANPDITPCRCHLAEDERLGW